MKLFDWVTKLSALLRKGEVKFSAYDFALLRLKEQPEAAAYFNSLSFRPLLERIEVDRSVTDDPTKVANLAVKILIRSYIANIAMLDVSANCSTRSKPADIVFLGKLTDC